MSESIETNNPNYKEAVQEIFDRAPFILGLGLGLELKETGPGWCETELVLAPKHQQQDGYIHAGVLASMADHTAGSAGTSLVHADEYVLSADFNISFLRAAQGHRLHCRAEVLKAGRRLIVVESAIYAVNGQESQLVAKARVTLAVLQRTPTPS